MKLNKRVNIKTNTIRDSVMHDGILLIKYAIDYPEFSSRDFSGAIERMNIFYRKMATDYQKYILENLKRQAIKDARDRAKIGAPFHPYEALLTYKTTYNQNCTISLYQDKYEYTGGAHGNTVRTSQTWDMETGRQQPLKAFFPGRPAYESGIKAIIIKQIAFQVAAGTDSYFDNYPALVNQTFNPKSFFLTPQAVVVYFQQYDIAPYVAGMPEFNIPYGSKPHCGK